MGALLGQERTDAPAGDDPWPLMSHDHLLLSNGNVHSVLKATGEDLYQVDEKLDAFPKSLPRSHKNIQHKP